jgi:hypothetical protein
MRQRLSVTSLARRCYAGVSQSWNVANEVKASRRPVYCIEANKLPIAPKDSV